MKIPPEQKPLGDFYVLDIFVVFCINYNWICLTIYRYRDNIHYNLCDIMSVKEKEAAAKQTFTFLAPLTNEQSCEAGRKSAKARVREYRADK